MEIVSFEEALKILQQFTDYRTAQEILRDSEIGTRTIWDRSDNIRGTIFRCGLEKYRIVYKDTIMMY